MLLSHATSAGRRRAQTQANVMSDDPISLDQRRGMAAQKATEIRRHLADVKADQAALRDRQAELERILAMAQVTTWSEAAEKARYLIELFAATPAAENPQRQRLIESVLEDFARLSTTSDAPQDDG